MTASPPSNTTAHGRIFQHREADSKKNSVRPVQAFSPVKCVMILPSKSCLLIHPKLRAYFSNLTPMTVALIAEEKRQGRYPTTQVAKGVEKD